MKALFTILSILSMLFLSSDLAFAKKGKGGNQIMPVEFYGQASSATLAAALVFTVTGLKNASECVVTAQALGTSVNYIKKAVVTADTITVTVDTAQSGGSTTINYICFKP
jgi:hypothetical protein